MVRLVQADEASLLFHDGWIDLDAIEADGASLRLRGVFERPLSSSQVSPNGRFTFRLITDGVGSWSLQDDANIGQLPIGGVESKLNRLRFTSPLPVLLEVRTANHFIEFLESVEPFEVQRFVRWRKVAPPVWP